MSDPQALHVTRNVIPGKLGVDLHLHRVHIHVPLVVFVFGWSYALKNWCVHGSSALLAHGPQIGPQVAVAWGTCPISKFRAPSISLGRMKPRFSNLVRTWSLGCSCTRTTNWPPSGRALEYVPNFEFLGPLNICGSDEATLFKFGAYMDPGLFLPRTTNWPPSGRGLGYVPNFEISGPAQYLSVGWSYASQIYMNSYWYCSIVTTVLSCTVSVLLYPVYSRPWELDPINFAPISTSQKTIVIELSDSRTSFRVGSAMLIQYRLVTDGQTNRRNIARRLLLCLRMYASHGRNWWI